MSDAMDLSKIDRLRVGAYSAARVRGARARPIKITDKSGAVIGEITSQELQKKVHARAGIEFDVVPGEKEIAKTCPCGRIFFAPPDKSTNHKVQYCKMCRFPPCNVCGGPCTKMSVINARRYETLPHCKAHTLPPVRTPLVPCHVCGLPSTRQSSWQVQRGRGRHAFCKDHKVDTGPKPILPCAVCGNPATHNSSNAARQRGHSALCETHKADRKAKPRAPCTVCGSPSTRESSRKSRSRGTKPFCSEHKGKGGPPKKVST